MMSFTQTEFLEDLIRDGTSIYIYIFIYLYIRSCIDLVCVYVYAYAFLDNKESP